MPNLISIIVPIYNASLYLSQCIESILLQTYKNLEIILINDGSTDSSVQICEKYKKIDRRIQFISQENGGSVIARQSGLKVAKGEYIGFVDADDYIELDMFEKLYTKIREFNADFIHSGMIFEHRKICDYQEGLVDFSLVDKATYIRQNIFEEQQMSFSLWSKLFKADLIKSTYMRLPDDQSYGEDLLCLCDCVSKCDKIYMYKEAFYHYRVHYGSLSHPSWLDICMEEAKLHGHVIKFLKKSNLLNECGNSARLHYRRNITSAMVKDNSSGINALRYNFKNVDVIKGKKIALYGAGKVGRDFYCQMASSKQCEIVVWVDKKRYGTSNLISICQPEILRDITYDVIVLAVKNKLIADEMREDLLQNEICKDDSLILWEEPVILW